MRARLGCATGLAALLAFGSVGLSSQGAQAQSPQARPTFRAGVNAVLVDLRVVDLSGRFVRDLAESEFRVFEDDKPQTITSFSLVNIPPPDVAAPDAPAPVPPDIVTNAKADEGRIYVIVLDDMEEETDDRAGYQMLRSVSVRAIARDFVEHHLGTDDRAALVTTSARRDMTVQFTNDKRRLLQAIDRFEGGYGQVFLTPLPPPQIIWVRDNLHSVMVSLRSIGEWLASIEGRRKAMLLVSERLGRSATTGGLSRGIDAISPLADQEALDVAEFLKSAARGNVSLYAIDPVGNPTGKPGNIKPLPLDDGLAYDNFRVQSLTVLAEATGGFAVAQTNDYATAFDQVVEDNSSYYLLGYTSTNAASDGKFRKIRVEVTRPRLKVRARSGYATEKPAAGRTTAAPGALPKDLADLVSSPIAVAGLPLSVVATPFRGNGATAAVDLVVELRPSQWPGAASAGLTGTIEVAIVAADRDGKTQASERGTLTLDVSAARRDTVAAQGVRLLSSLQLKPGEYNINVSAVASGDANARGSLRYDLTVPDFTKGLTMSGIALASFDSGSIPTRGTQGRSKEPLGGAPTTVRSFSSSDELRSFVEIYDNDSRPHQTTVRTAVRSTSDEVVFERRQARTPGAPGEAFQELTAIPLVDVAPGSYVLTVEAVSSAQPNQPVVRQVPFTVRESQ